MRTTERSLGLVLGDVGNHCRVTGTQVRWPDLWFQNIAGCGLGWKTVLHKCSEMVEGAVGVILAGDAEGWHQGSQWRGGEREQ